MTTTKLESTVSTGYRNLSSILTTTKHGVTKNQMRDHLTNSFHFTSFLPRKLLASYFTRVWTSGYFKQEVKEGLLVVNGKSYQVIYNCCTRFKLLSSFYVKLSFREPLPEFDLPAYVLVKPTARPTGKNAMATAIEGEIL